MRSAPAAMAAATSAHVSSQNRQQEYYPMLGSLIVICANLSTTMISPQVVSSVEVPALHPIEARVIEKTNSQRTRHGLPPLAVDSSLLRSARRHAAWMTNSRSMTHTTQPVGENIAMGQQSSSEVLNS